MIKIDAYQADDGKKFLDLGEYQDYENYLSDNSNLDYFAKIFVQDRTKTEYGDIDLTEFYKKAEDVINEWEANGLTYSSNKYMYGALLAIDNFRDKTIGGICIYSLECS
ncbi:MAG: hypothetical protein QM504_08005 [Pseudomonadota bacterium]